VCGSDASAPAGDVLSARATQHGSCVFQRRCVRIGKDGLLIVAGGLGLWMVLVVLVLAASRAAALADLDQTRQTGRRPRHRRP
jgi:hypothetical protein